MSRVVLPYNQLLDDNGDPLSAARAYTFEAGTSTIHQLYSDEARTIVHGDYVEADSAGRFPDAYGDPAQGLKIVYRLSDGTTEVDTFDDVYPPIDASDTAESRTDLGLGSIVTESIGTSGDAVGKLNAANIYSALQTFNAGIEVNSTSAGAAEAPTVRLSRDSASPAVDDALGEVVFDGKDDGGGDVEYASIHAVVLDETDGTEDGGLALSVIVNGSKTEIARLSSAGLDIKSGSLLIGGSTAIDPFRTTGQTVTADTTLTVAHSLGEDPDRVNVRLRCVTADLGYSTGDEVHMSTNFDNTGDKGITVWCDATNVNIEQGASIEIISQTSQNIEAITVGNWLWDIEAFVDNV